jgi:hypothetical protein
MLTLSVRDASSAVIIACANKTSGQLRIVASARLCKSYETSVSWNQEGPPGPKGATGPQGPTGPQGLPGADADSGPAIVTRSIPNGEPGVQYSELVEASGGRSPYEWTLLSGSLPDGLQLNAESGEIAGTPGTAGTTSFRVQVTDDDGRIAQRSLSICLATTEECNGLDDDCDGVVDGHVCDSYNACTATANLSCNTSVAGNSCNDLPAPSPTYTCSCNAVGYTGTGTATCVLVDK